MTDTPRTALHEINPPRPVTVDLRDFGPRRIRWGVGTPQWVRARGWRPDREVPAVAEFSVLSMYGDWWVYCRTDLVTAGGQVLQDGVGLLLPGNVVKPA